MLSPIKITLSVMIAIHVILVVDTARQNAPLFDEPAHLVAGVAHRRFGRFDIYPVNPPLIRTAASLAVEAFDVKFDWRLFSPDVTSHCETPLAVDFIHRNQAQCRTVFFVARCLCLPFTILGALVCYVWSAELFGGKGGLISAGCWCFCPNIVGLSGVLLPDMGAAAMAIFAAWRFYCWLICPTSRTVCMATLALGLALLTKMTLILLIGPFALAFFIHQRSLRLTDQHQSTPSACGLTAILLGSVYILNLAYGFEGTGRRLGDYAFVSPTFNGIAIDRAEVVSRGNRFRDTWLAGVPLPLPESYVTGIDLQKRDFDKGLSSYLRGSWADRGWWYYYLYALLVKVPFPLLALTCIGWMTRPAPISPPPNRAAAYALLLGFPAVLLIVASSQTGFSHHLRYVLPLFPFWFVWLGRVSAVATCKPFARSLVLVLIAWLAIEAPFCHPHELSYFNEIVGGSRNGHNHLLESNCDWGQDLYLLESWATAHPEARPLVIDYYGLTSADAYGGLSRDGILLESPGGQEFKILSMQNGPLWICVSVHNLHLHAERYRELRRHEPAARIGHSMLIYSLRAFGPGSPAAVGPAR